MPYTTYGARCAVTRTRLEKDAFMDSFIVRPVRASEGATVCSYTDAAVRYFTASVGFCYPVRLDVARLRDALAQVLSDFPEYAGQFRSIRGGLVIEHSGKGAGFEVASSPERFAALVKAASKSRKGTLLCPAMSTRPRLRGRDPLLRVRLTNTVDGCVLALTWNHAVGDMASTMHLLRAWSQAYSNAAYEPPPLVPDRAQYLDAHLPDSANAVPSLRLVPVSELGAALRFYTMGSRRVDIEFSADELAQLRESTLRESYITAGDALCAHAFLALRALRPERPLTRLGVMVNYRKRMGLPTNLLGNLINGVWMNVGRQADPAELAAELRAKVDAYASEFADYHVTRRFIDQHPRRFERVRLMPVLHDPSCSTWFVTNAISLGFYDVAFDGTPPTLFSPLMDSVIPLMAAVFDGPNQRGATLSLHLPEALAKRVESPEGRARMHSLAPNLA
jgi:hypothetical protein